MRYELPSFNLPPPISTQVPIPGEPVCVLTIDQIYTEFLRFYQKYGDLNTVHFRNAVFREVKRSLINNTELLDLPLSVTITTEW